MSYDRWLEAPIQEMYAAGDAFVDWCERNDIDPDDPGAHEQYDDYVDGEREAAAEAKAEARSEADYDWGDL